MNPTQHKHQGVVSLLKLVQKQHGEFGTYSTHNCGVWSHAPTVGRVWFVQGSV